MWGRPLASESGWLMPYDHDQIDNLDSELDELSTPTSFEVFEVVGPYDPSIIGASAVRRAMEGGGGSLPAGGSTGEVLTKASDDDGDADWEPPGGGSLPDGWTADSPAPGGLDAGGGALYSVTEVSGPQVGAENPPTPPIISFENGFVGITAASANALTEPGANAILAGGSGDGGSTDGAKVEAEGGSGDGVTDGRLLMRSGGASGEAGQALVSDGAGGAVWGDVGSQPVNVVVLVSAGEAPLEYTAASGDYVVSDDQDGGILIHLPATPTAGAAVTLFTATQETGTTVDTTDGSTINGEATLNSNATSARLTLVFDGTNWGYEAAFINVNEVDSPSGSNGAFANVNFSAAISGIDGAPPPGGSIAPYMAQGDNDHLYEVTLQYGSFRWELGPVGLGSEARPWAGAFIDLPTADPVAAAALWNRDGMVVVSGAPSPPVVPLTDPSVQDVIDALVTLGLVSQSD